MTEHLAFLVASVLQLVVVLHLGLPLSDLDHVVEVDDFDIECFLFTVNKALMVAQT